LSGRGSSCFLGFAFASVSFCRWCDALLRRTVRTCRGCGRAAPCWSGCVRDRDRGAAMPLPRAAPSLRLPLPLPLDRREQRFVAQERVDLRQIRRQLAQPLRQQLLPHRLSTWPPSSLSIPTSSDRLKRTHFQAILRIRADSQRPRGGYRHTKNQQAQPQNRATPPNSLTAYQQRFSGGSS
jgi:hypothetical protein